MMHGQKNIKLGVAVFEVRQNGNGCIRKILDFGSIRV